MDCLHRGVRDPERFSPPLQLVHDMVDAVNQDEQDVQHLRCAGAERLANRRGSGVVLFFLELASRRIRRVGGLSALQLPAVKWSVRGACRG